MKLRMDSLYLLPFFLISLFSSTTFLIQCEARGLKHSRNHLQAVRHSKSSQMKAVKHLDSYYYSSSDPYSYTGPPFNLPPYDDAMGPSSPQDNPPFCIYPPLTPNAPSTTPPSPVTFIPSPPPPPSATTTPGSPEFTVPNPPGYVPNPPEFGPSPPTTVPNPPEFGYSPPTNVPSPPEFGSSPPTNVPSPPGYEPSPPGLVPNPPPSFTPNPPGYVPEPPVFVPGPPIFLPPVVYPPPVVPPPPPSSISSTRGLWCVAKPAVPDPIIQEAMNYACGSGADCQSIMPNGSCYQPDTVLDHASFAFNSYWQRTKVAGGTCDFGGTAMLVTKDPSHDGCRFIIV